MRYSRDAGRTARQASGTRHLSRVEVSQIRLGFDYRNRHSTRIDRIVIVGSYCAVERGDI